MWEEFDPIGMSLDEFMSRILGMFPDWQFGDDNDGQITVYTGLKVSEGKSSIAAGDLEPFEGD